MCADVVSLRLNKEILHKLVLDLEDLEILIVPFGKWSWKLKKKKKDLSKINFIICIKFISGVLTESIQILFSLNFFS